MAKQHDDEPILQRVGANLRAWRIRHGLTRDELGERIGTDGKNLYRLESGTENLTLVRAQRIAQALGLRVEDLLAEPRHRGWTGELEDLGLAVVSPSHLDNPDFVPVYDLRPAAGSGESQPEPQRLGRVRGLRKLGSGMDLFVAKVVGESMQPRIQSGTWNVFSTALPADLLGAVVLLAERGASSDWAWLLKRVEQVALVDDDARLLTVRGTAAGQVPRIVRLDASEDAKVIAVWRGPAEGER